MGDGFWASTDKTEYSDMVRSLIGGMAKPGVGPAMPLDTDESTNDPSSLFTQSFSDILTVDKIQDNTFVTGDSGFGNRLIANTTYAPMKFGLMRAALQATSVTVNDGTDNFIGKHYVEGPFWDASVKLSNWRDVISRFLPTSSVPGVFDAETRTGIITNDTLDSTANPITVNALFGEKLTDESWLAQGLSQLVDSSLIIESGGSDAADIAVGMYTYAPTIATALGAPSTTIAAGTVPSIGTNTIPSAASTDDATADDATADDATADDASDPASAWSLIAGWDSITWAAPAIDPGSITAAISLYTPILQTVTALTAFLTTEPSIAAPVIVEVEDNIDAAVSAYSAAADLRYAEEEGRIKASLYGARAHMSTYMDNTLQLLAAKKQAEIAEFEANLRVEQTRQKMQVGLEYQKQTLDRNTQLAVLKLDAEKANLGAHTAFIGHDIQAKIRQQELALQQSERESSLILEAEKQNVVNKIALYDSELRRVITQAEHALRGDIAKLETLTRVALNNSEQGTRVALNNSEQGTRVALNNSEQGTRVALSNSEQGIRVALAKFDADVRAELSEAEMTTQVNTTKFQGDLQATIAQIEAGLKLFDSKIDILESIYRAVIGTISLKAQNLGNAGAVVNLLQTVIDNNMKATDSYRNYLLNFEKTRYDLATQASSAISSVAELRWKSQLQNMMVIKEALSAIGVAPSGTEHHPSGFEKMGQGVSGVGALASTIMTIGNLF